MPTWLIWTLGALLALIAVVALYDVTQRQHAILRNFPVIGHFRYWLEAVGPELRQYIVTSNNEERPFSRDERRWVYATAKKQNTYFGFGTDMEIEKEGHLLLKHDTLPAPYDADERERHGWPLPCAKVVGAYRGRPKAFRPTSVVGISAMSYGSLSGPAIEALNRGAAAAGCLHNTGEGGISRFHRKGGDLIWQLGTGYFGARAEDGGFSIERFRDVVAANPTLRAIEIKLSQGAKPGVGGMLPATKITPEIAEARGIPPGKDCASPSSHSAFSSTEELLDFVERLAEESGLPVGIKSAVGRLNFWRELARLMERGDRAVDFISIDGGEGGTGAAPLAFSDHVSLPFKVGFARVFKLFAERGLADRTVFIGSGKLGHPERAMLAFGLGADLLNLAREPMLAIGCIQAQRCHTDHCPTGVATHNAWLVRGLDPHLKAVRCANYLIGLRKEITRLTHALGDVHPSLVTSDRFEITDGRFGATSLLDLFGYQRNWGRPGAAEAEAIREIMSRSPV